jgi:hypothetical protein
MYQEAANGLGVVQAAETEGEAQVEVHLVLEAVLDMKVQDLVQLHGDNKDLSYTKGAGLSPMEGTLVTVNWYVLAIQTTVANQAYPVKTFPLIPENNETRCADYTVE